MAVAPILNFRTMLILCIIGLFGHVTGITDKHHQVPSIPADKMRPTYRARVSEPHSRNVRGQLALDIPHDVIPQTASMTDSMEGESLDTTNSDSVASTSGPVNRTNHEDIRAPDKTDDTKPDPQNVTLPKYVSDDTTLQTCVQESAYADGNICASLPDIHLTEDEEEQTKPKQVETHDIIIDEE